MNSETAFLSAIAESPADDSLRLAFADWLDERNDFRGEFVRLGVEWERLPPWELRRFEIGDRLTELLQSPAFVEWLPKHPAFRWGWRRGLLRLIADTKVLQLNRSKTVAQWLRTLWVERVEFEGYTSEIDIFWKDTFGLVSQTRELHFGYDDYGPDALKRLRKWPHLRRLRMSDLGSAWKELQAMPKLGELVLDNPDWTLMPGLPKVRMPNLETFDLEKEWNAHLPHWGECYPQLRTLRLTHYNTYPDKQIERFGECPELRRLELYQRYKPFTKVGIKALAKIRKLRTLALGPWPDVTIEELADLPHLEHLAGDRDAQVIDGLESLTQLRRMSFDTDRFTFNLASQLASLPNLARLDLIVQGFELESLAELAKASSLRILTIHLKRDSELAAELRALEQLRRVRIGKWKVTEAEQHACREALPNAKVVFGYGDPREDGDDWIV